MTVNHINRWHKVARPEPTERDFDVQLGCHIEEVAEMIADLKFGDMPGADTPLYNNLMVLATRLKRGEIEATVLDRENFLKELCDQVVTATGVAHCAKMNLPEALEKVDHSNWSKFGKDCQPIRDENGKIIKGTAYMPPDLTGLY